MLVQLCASRSGAPSRIGARVSGGRLERSGPRERATRALGRLRRCGTTVGMGPVVTMVVTTQALRAGAGWRRRGLTASNNADQGRRAPLAPASGAEGPAIESRLVHRV